MAKKLNNQELEDLLKDFGFNQYKRKIYWALLTLKEATVIEINKLSKVPLSKIYEVINDLMHDGLVELSEIRPKKYKVVHSTDFFENIIKSREKELVKLKKENKKLLEFFKKIKEKPSYRFNLMQGKQQVIENIAKTVDGTSYSYWAVITFTTYPNPLIPVLKRKIREGLEAKVIGPPGKEKTAKEYKNLGAQVKIIDILDNITRFSIHDKKYLYFTFPDVEKDYTSLFTNSPYLIKKMIELFNYYWQKGEKIR